MRPVHLTDAARAGLLVLVALAVLAWIFLPYLPAEGVRAGGDYSLHLPNLLAGDFWFVRNGPFAVPWFSPAQCAGVPFLADLNVAYYSFPQWATFVAGPVAAVRATFVVFAAVGAAGAYALLRGPFAASPWAAATAAVLFASCGFYSARMLIGHLTFHPFALTPWVAWAVLGAGQGAARRALAVCAAGIAFALMFHAGMVHAIAPLAVAVGVIVLLHGHAYGYRAQPWALFGAAVLLALALSAQRMAAGVAFLQQFPRDEYGLPGFTGFADQLSTVLRALFWRPPAEAGRLLSNVTWSLERHEWEYGLGPAAALLLLAGAARVDWRRWNTARGRTAAAAIVLALALPLALNWYQPEWHSALKGLPLIGSSSNLVRWYVLYVPIVVVCAALALDLAVPRPWRGRVAALVAVVTLAWTWSDDRSFYRTEGYDATAIERAWRALAAGAPVPSVTRISARLDRENRLMAPIDRNDDLTRGGSQLVCYQPMFGYRLEHLSFADLRLGPALAVLPGGVLNLKNPACYLFPAENGCRPGDHFRADQRAEAEKLLAYRPFDFERPWWQRAADVLNAAALLLAVAALSVAGWLAWKERASAGATRGSR